MRYFWLLIFLACCFSTYAQENGAARQITGIIQDEDNNSVPYASVALYQEADSTLIDGTLSDDNGKFKLHTKAGRYYIKITFISFEEKFIPVIVTNQNVGLGSIALQSVSRVLQEVVVTGERSQMELKLDKRIFNVGKDLNNTGGNAADILDNIPSVSVDVDGTVSLRGSENVRILINGKPSGLTLRDPDALRQLQANLIERVEVVTNPSARYDAEGDVGIINIILKENKENGINGTFTATAGHPDFLGGSYSLNIRRKKINFFSGYGIDYRENPGYTNTFQRFTSGDTVFTSYRHNKRTRSELSHNLRGGLDYFIDEKSSITGSVMYNFSDGENPSVLSYRDYQNDVQEATTIRTDREKEDEYNIEAALNYKREFSDKDHALSADFQFIKSEDAENSDYTQTGETDNIVQRGKNVALEQNWFLQVDYVRPFSKDGRAEAGIRSTTRRVDNDYNLEQLNNEGNWNAFPLTNNMIYNERIHAAYFMVGNKFEKLSVQAGVRGEYSDIKTELILSNDVNHRNYLDLFPSVNLAYALTKNKTIQLSYAKRVNRPRFRHLLPFSNFNDTRNLFMGNPDLNPEYTHAFESGYLANWERGSILASAYYRYRQGVIERINQIDEDELGVITRIIPVNLSAQNVYGLEFNLFLNPVEWLQINSNANFYRAITEGRYNEEIFYGDTHTFNSRTTSKISLPKKLDIQASFNYRAPRVTTQGKQLSSYSLDLALAKEIFSGKATISANVRDILNTRKRRSVIDIPGYYSTVESQWRPRQFMLTFTYRLNQVKQRGERDTQSNDDSGMGEDF